MDLPSPGWGGDVGRTTVDLNINHPSPKHFCAIYFDKANYGPVSGGREEYRGAGFGEVVVAGEPQSR